ncbi:MAG TPA: hypothetical protein VMN39_01510, partial [Longimicrobiaceae bacterium]|nr:hypothetical protein [Longimicrobiaceae bacterium]
FLFSSILLPCPHFVLHEGVAEIQIPDGWSLSQAVGAISASMDVTVTFSNCPAGFEDRKLDGGSVRGDDVAELLENLQYRLVGTDYEYEVRAPREGVRYEIRCN